MGILRNLQEATARKLKEDPWLAGAAVLVEKPEDPLWPLAARAGVGGVRLTVLAPAFLLNETVTDPADGDAQAGPGRVLRGEALLSIEASLAGRPGPDCPAACASDLAEQVLCVLEGWEHGLGWPGVLRAERQALAPGPRRASSLKYLARFAKGGTEKFRREVRELEEDESAAPYYIHFWTEVELSQQGV
jgi:hypothetical protein